MAPDTDPYRTLGLTRDATLDEVRRAYRRLAKANHPDAAGEAALPRFLAIQAAYDTIAGPDAGRRRPGAARPASPGEPGIPIATAPTRPYRAYGGPVARGRARPVGRERRADRPDQRGSGRRRMAAPGPRPARPERPPNKATLGSTSYDGADAEPFEPDWGGASWYGTTSGTYWTLNPKEYADPRKHGPEYQARARRELRGRDEADGIDPAGAAVARPRRRVGGPSRPSRRPRAATSRRWPRIRPRRGGRPRPVTRPEPRARRPLVRAAAAREGPPARSPPGHRRRRASPRRRDRRPRPAATGGRSRGRRHVVGCRSPGRLGSGLTPDGILEAVRSWLDDDRPGAIGRIARAIVGWAPIALGIGWVGGEISGCGRFAAGCDDAAVMSAWLVADRGARGADRRRSARPDRLGRHVGDARRRDPGRAAAVGHGEPRRHGAGRIALSGLLVDRLGRRARVRRRPRAPWDQAPRERGPPGVAGPGRPVS